MKIEANIYLYGLWLYYCIRRLERMIDLEKSGFAFAISPEDATINVERLEESQTSPQDIIVQLSVDNGIPNFSDYTDTALPQDHSRIPDISSYFSNLFYKFCSRLEADRILEDYDISDFFDGVKMTMTDINYQVFPLGGLNTTLSSYLTNVDNPKLKVLSHAIGYNEVVNPNGDKLTLPVYVKLLRQAVFDGIEDQRFKNVSRENFINSLQDDSETGQTAEEKFMDCNSHTDTTLTEGLQEMEARFLELRQVLLST